MRKNLKFLIVLVLWSSFGRADQFIVDCPNLENGYRVLLRRDTIGRWSYGWGNSPENTSGWIPATPCRYSNDVSEYSNIISCNANYPIEGEFKIQYTKYKRLRISLTYETKTLPLKKGEFYFYAHPEDCKIVPF